MIDISEVHERIQYRMGEDSCGLKSALGHGGISFLKLSVGGC